MYEYLVIFLTGLRCHGSKRVYGVLSKRPGNFFLLAVISKNKVGLRFISEMLMSILLSLQTFRPKKKFSPGTLRYSLHKQAQASLSSGINLRAVVKLPPGEEMNDWIAVHGMITTSVLFIV